jgi:hypothetical protein
MGAIAFLGYSCEKESDFPPEPVITDIRFDYDEYHLIVEFTDGDGDFGITQGDPNFPDSVDGEPNPFYRNMWIDCYQLIDGEWFLTDPPDALGYIVPDLTPQGQSKQLQVEITNDLSEELPFVTFVESDTIKFVVTLVDRAKNISEPAETEALYIPL